MCPISTILFSKAILSFKYYIHIYSTPVKIGFQPLLTYGLYQGLLKLLHGIRKIKFIFIILRCHLCSHSISQEYTAKFSSHYMARNIRQNAEADMIIQQPSIKPDFKYICKKCKIISSFSVAFFVSAK